MLDPARVLVQDVADISVYSLALANMFVENCGISHIPTKQKRRSTGYPSGPQTPPPPPPEGIEELVMKP
jgi:hypothetical protein